MTDCLKFQLELSLDEKKDRDGTLLILKACIPTKEECKSSEDPQILFLSKRCLHSSPVKKSMITDIGVSKEKQTRHPPSDDSNLYPGFESLAAKSTQKQTKQNAMSLGSSMD